MSVDEVCTSSISSGSSTSALGDKMTAPTQVSSWLSEGRKVCDLTTMPSPGASYSGRDVFGIIACIKTIWGGAHRLWRSDALLEQNLKDLLSVRAYLSDLRGANIELETKRVVALQALSMIVAYREPDLFKEHFHSFTFDFPLKEGSANYSLEEIIDLGSGIKAFGFVSEQKEAPPLLLYHGTFSYTGSRACLSTIRACFEIEGPGYATFKRNQDKITNWLASKATGGTQAIVSGHSLGASFALYTAVDCAQHVQEATVFSAPGVNKEMHAAYTKLPKKPQISVYNPKGDIICTLGGSHTVGDVYEGKGASVSTSLFNILPLHISPFLLKGKNFVYTKIVNTANYTKDIRPPLLAGAYGGMGFALYLLTKLALIPTITALVIAGTWPLALAAVIGGVVLFSCLYLVRTALMKIEQKRIEKTAQKKLFFKTLEELKEALKNKEITPKEFAYCYRTQFYSLEIEKIPFKVALLKELTKAYHDIAGLGGSINFENMKEEKVVTYLFHPHRLFDELESTKESKKDLGPGFDTNPLRTAWKEVSSPAFLAALEQYMSAITADHTYENEKNLQAAFNSQEITLQ